MIIAPKREVQRLEFVIAEMRQSLLDTKGSLSLNQAMLEEEKLLNSKHMENMGIENNK